MALNRVIFSLVTLFVLFPAFAHALAGFPQNSIWLSSSSATAGETVTISTVVHNAEKSAISGTVVFLVDEKSVGAQSFELKSGESRILSLGWTSIEGEHSFKAKVENTSGFTPAVTTTDAVVLSVAKPMPSPIAEVTNQITNVTSTLLASTSPAVQSIANSIYSTTESWREAGAMYLSEALKDVKSSPAANGPSVAAGTATPAESGAVLGTSTIKSTAAAESAGSSIFSRAWSGLMSFLLLVFSSAAFFYPFFAILFFVLLYIARRVLRRPNHY